MNKLPADTAVELWFQDEMRVGQKNGLVYQWARQGTRPRQPADQRYESAYLFGAVCPARDTGAALAMPSANTEAMQKHLDEIGRNVTPGAHAIVLLDQAGWHTTEKLEIPKNLTLLPIPPASPELNAAENIWQYLRQTYLANRIFKDYDEIIAACCEAWRRLEAETGRIRSIATRSWASTPGEYVLLAVADTGTGMSAEIMQRAFEPFFTTKEVGQGSGLGLSMVYGFVKQSGGHVSIYSRVGQGTCVKLYLPRAPSSPVGREEESLDVFPEDLGNRVVLVVEDEARLRKVAVKMLDRLGLQSLQAETAKDALELLADTHVDVLFTDIELPGGMNGTELAEVAHQLYPELKVLFTTGYARETTLQSGACMNTRPGFSSRIRTRNSLAS